MTALKSIDDFTGSELLAMSKTEDGTYNRVDYAVGYCYGDQIYTLQNIRVMNKVRNQALKPGLSALGPFWRDQQEVVDVIQNLQTDNTQIMDARLGGARTDLSALGVLSVHRVLEFIPWPIEMKSRELSAFEKNIMFKPDGDSCDKTVFALGYTFDKIDYSVQNIRTLGKISHQSLKRGLSENGPFYQDTDTALNAIQQLIKEKAEITDTRLAMPLDLTALKPMPVHSVLKYIQQV